MSKSFPSNASLSDSAYYSKKVDSEKNIIDKSVSAGSTADPTEPPLDSAYGWVVALSSCFILMISVGLTSSFGIYLSEYHINIFPSTSTSTLSWIGSLQFGFMTFCGVGAGILVERFDTRVVIALGSIVSGIAFIVASFCKTPVALIFTQGILFGVGGSCLMNPSMSLTAQWMQKYRSFATGIAVAGGSIGGLWTSFATEAMVSKLGWHWSLRITGFVIIGVGLVASTFMRTRVLVTKRDKIVDLDVLTDIKFLVLFLGAILGAGAYFMPFNFMPSYVEIVIGKPSIWGANISSILNGSGIAGRILMGMLGDYIGPFNTIIIGLLVSTVAILVLWLPFEQMISLVASAALFGFASGSIVSLMPVITACLFGIKRLPSIYGLLAISYTFGVFIGSPVGGVLLDKYGHGLDYTPLIAYIGVMFFIATLLFFTLRIMLNRNLLVKI